MELKVEFCIEEVEHFDGDIFELLFAFFDIELEHDFDGVRSQKADVSGGHFEFDGMCAVAGFAGQVDGLCVDVR